MLRVTLSFIRGLLFWEEPLGLLFWEEPLNLGLEASLPSGPPWGPCLDEEEELHADVNEPKLRVVSSAASCCKQPTGSGARSPT